MSDKRKRSVNNQNKNIRSLEAKRKEIRKYRNRKRMFTTLLIILSLLIVPSLIRNVFGTSADTFIVKIGTIENSFNTTGLVIRDELILKSNIEGSLIPFYKEGDKVSKNSVIATVVSSESEELLDEIKTLETRIMQAKEELARQSEFFKDDINKIDSQIEECVLEIAKFSAKGNIAECKQLEKDINNLVQKKSDILNSSEDQNAFLNSLNKKKAALQESLDNKIAEIVNEEAGIVSYFVDGYEQELNTSLLKSLDVEKVEGIIDKISENKINVNKDNSSYAKVINNLYYYFVCSIDSKTAESLKEGNFVDVRINDNNTFVKMSVYDIKKESDKSLVILRSNINLGSVTSLRLVDLDIITSEAEGLKIPFKALVDYNNIDKTAQVACVKYGYVRFVPVEVVAYNKDYAIVKNVEETRDFIIKFNDFVITNPKDFEEGQLV